MTASLFVDCDEWGLVYLAPAYLGLCLLHGNGSIHSSTLVTDFPLQGWWRMTRLPACLCASLATRGMATCSLELWLLLIYAFEY